MKDELSGLLNSEEIRDRINLFLKTMPEEMPLSLIHIFFTFWEFQAEDQYYDNVPAFRDHGYWVYCYSIDPDRIERLIWEIEQSLREKGFIVEGGAIDAKSDEASHSGKMITVYVKEDLYGKRNL